MTCRMADDSFLTLTPWARTSAGSCGSARLTRFCASTVLMSGSVPTVKLIFSV